jgi:hypothetical protein
LGQAASSSSTDAPTIWVLRQEFLNQDAKRLEDHLLLRKDTTTTTNNNNNDSNTGSSFSFFPVESKHYIKPNNVAAAAISLTDSDKQMLCACVLRDELRIYQRLIQGAENLSLEEKQETFRLYWKGCGVRVVVGVKNRIMEVVVLTTTRRRTILVLGKMNKKIGWEWKSTNSHLAVLLLLQHQDRKAKESKKKNASKK